MYLPNAPKIRYWPLRIWGTAFSLPSSVSKIIVKSLFRYTYFFAAIAFPAAIFKDGIGIGDDGIRWRG